MLDCRLCCCVIVPCLLHEPVLGASVTFSLNAIGNPQSSLTLVMPYHDRFGSILLQIMACCPSAPSHYLNQC